MCCDSDMCVCVIDIDKIKKYVKVIAVCIIPK